MNNKTIQSKQTEQNRKKLIQQNKNLFRQIHDLQISLNKVLNQNQEVCKQHIIQEDSTNSQIKQHLFVQQNQIKKLKQKIYYLKSSNAKANALYIQKQQNDLLCLKRQRQALQQEKIILQRGTKDKRLVLQINKNLAQHKTDLQKDWNTAKSYNKQNNLKFGQIQRQIRKYHYIKQISKKSSATGEPISLCEDIQDLKFKLQQITRETLQKKQEIKKVQDTWKQQLQALDNEYFQLKSTYLKKKTVVQSAQKQISVFKYRAGSLREQGDILKDRKKMEKMSQSKSFHHQNPTQSKVSYNQRLSSNTLKAQFLLTQVSLIKQKVKKSSLNNVSYDKKPKAIFPTTKFIQNQIKSQRNYSSLEQSNSGNSKIKKQALFVKDLFPKQQKQKKLVQSSKLKTKSLIEIDKKQSLQKVKVSKVMKDSPKRIMNNANQQKLPDKKQFKQSQRYIKQKREDVIQKKESKNQKQQFSQRQLFNKQPKQSNQRSKPMQQGKNNHKRNKQLQFKGTTRQKNNETKTSKGKETNLQNKINSKDTQVLNKSNTKLLEKQANKNTKALAIYKQQTDLKNSNFRQGRKGVKIQNSNKKQQAQNSNKKQQTQKEQIKIKNQKHNQHTVIDQKKLQQQKDFKLNKIEINISNRKTKRQEDNDKSKKNKQYKNKIQDQNQLIKKQKQNIYPIFNVQNKDQSGVGSQQPQIRRVVRKKVAMNTSEMGVGTQF